MKIRPATLHDASDIYALLLRMWEEVEMDFGDLDHESSMQEIVTCITRGIAIVAETEEFELIGSVGARVHRWWWSSTPYVADSWFYVSPDHRASRAGRKLLKEIREKATDAQLPLVLGVFNGEDTRRKDEFYVRAGMKYAGGTYTEGL